MKLPDAMQAISFALRTLDAQIGVGDSREPRAEKEEMPRSKPDEPLNP